MPNIGTLSGLVPATHYVFDAVHVDDWGNVSAVASSLAFTTSAAPVTNFAYIGTATDLDAQASYTFTDADVTGLDFTAGGKFLVLAHTHQDTNSGSPELAEATGVTIGGVAGVAAEPTAGYPTPHSTISATVTAWVATVSAGATEQVVVTAPTGADWSGVAITVYQIDGYAIRDVVTHWDQADGTPLNLNTESGSPVLLGVMFDDAPAVAGNLNVDASLGTPDADGNVALGEEWGSYSDDAASATETRSFAFSTVNGNIRYAVTMIALEVA